MMSDTMGKLPHPKTAEDALKEILNISNDKRGHITWEDSCKWLELKLKAISIIAKRGIAKIDKLPKQEDLHDRMPIQSNPYKPGDLVVLKNDIRDGYGDTWHSKGDKVRVQSIAEDGQGLMFSSQLGTKWTNVDPCKPRSGHKTRSKHDK
jgi:hypothetical protein